MALGRGVIGEAAIRVRPDTSTFEKDTKKSVLGTVGKIAAATGAGVAIWKGFNFAKDAVIGFNSTLEQAHAAFKNLLGSGNAANDMLAKLQDFAKTTPFEFKQLIPVSQQLVGALGKSADVTKIMTQLGDAISATGGDSNKLNQLTLAYTQMATSGTAHLGDLMQINNAVPGALARMAKASGQSVGEFRESVSKSMVSSADAVKLFHDITTDKKFGIAGGMEAQSKTFQGAMSNISDAATQMIAQAGKPLFDFVNRLTHSFADFLSTMQDKGLDAAIKQAFGDTAVTALHILEGAFKILIGSIKDAFSILDTIIGLIRGNMTIFLTLAAVVTSVFLAWKAWVGIQKIWIGIQKVVYASMVAFNIVMSLNPIGLVVLAIVALVAALVVLYNRNETVRNAIQAAFKFFSDTVIPFLRDTWAGAVEFAGKVWKAWGDEVMAVVGVVVAVVRAHIDLLVGAFRAGVEIVRALWDRFGSAIMSVIRIALKTIVGVVKGELQVLKGIFNVFAGILTGDWRRVWNGLKGIASGALQAVGSVLRGFISVARDIAGRIGGAIKDGFLGAITGIGNALGNAMKGALNAGIGAVNSAIGKANSFIADIPFGPSWRVPPIPTLARGVSNFQGGLAIVGERGPELVHLPPHSSVTPNDKIGGQTFNITIVQREGESAQALARRVMDEAAARVTG